MNLTFTGVVAMDANRGIGYRGGLPWHLPDDLKTFKRLTTGHPILMGRKTFESIGKPLPNRQNIVLTRNPHYSSSGVQVVSAYDELQSMPLINPEVMVIGGAEIFRLMLPYLSKMWVSHISGQYQTDTFLPVFEDRLIHKTLQERFEGFDLYLYRIPDEGA